MRSVLLFVLGLIIGGCRAPLTAPPAPAPIVAGPEALGSKTIALVAEREEDEGVRAYCSGVWLSPRVIATAGHCIHGDPGSTLGYVVREDVFLPDSYATRPFIHARPAKFVAMDEDHDLALLLADKETAPPEHDFAAFAPDESIVQGETVQTMGHPAGLWYSYSAGVVAAVRREVVGLEIVWVQSTAAISPGNSGGGLFDSQGRLVGICSRGYTGRAQALNFWVHAHYLRDLFASSGYAR